MFKKVLALAMSLVFCVTFSVGCNKKTGGGSNTTGDGDSGDLVRGEPITLTYASWEKDPFEEFMIQKFQEKYDWITVDSISIDQNSWDAGLMQLADSHDLPDVFWCFNVAMSTENGWTLDITEYYDNDEYNKTIPEDLKKVGIYDGKRYGVAVHQFPWVIYLNKGLFEASNIEMPPYNWTFDDFVSAAKSLSVPGQYYFGIGNSQYYLHDIFPILYTDNLLDLGFDPKTETFNWDTRIKGLNTENTLINQKVMGVISSEEIEKAYGDASVWMPETNKIAMQCDWFWTGTYLQSVVFTSQNIEWVAYPLPTGTSGGRQLSSVDCGAVSATTKHPREAYELLKFMNYGHDGWMAKIEYLKQQSNPIPTHLPINVNDEEVMNELKKILSGEDWAAVFESLKKSSPNVRYWLPGQSEFWNWCEEQEIYTKLTANELKIEDVAPQLEQKLKEFYDQSMTKIKARS